MEFVEIKEKEYRDFWENHPQKTFLSAPEIGKLREKSGWTTYFVGLKDNKKLIASAMLLSHKRHFNKLEFYSPRGLLVDYKDLDTYKIFIEKIKEFVKEHNGYVFRMDPYIIYKQRDIDGNIVEDGIDNSNVVEFLKKEGFKQLPVEEREQVSWMFSLGLEGKNEQEILKEMKSNTRNTIRKTEKIGITIKELKYDELDRFQKIMIETGERKNFSVRGVEYYQNMYKLFADKGEVKYFVTELNLKDYIKKLQEEKKEKEQKIESLSDAKYNEGQKKGLTNEINSIDKRIKEAEETIKEKQTDTITLSGSMFIIIKPEIIYLSSGNYSEFMKYNSQYLLQWMMIKYGIENGFKKHNFYGIPADINTHPKDYGIYEFKRGFNGYVEELIGEFVLPITWHYKLLKLIQKIKKH
ncbi:MAG: aminoacyltransferase [Firmicutes bacterium]|nr:aminoacyltransferase [Bacillota bacterium]